MTFILWILLAGVIGFAVPAITAGLLRLPRSWLLVPYVGLIGGFCFLYLRWDGVDVGQALARNWLWGIIGAVVVGALMTKNVASQPPSTTPKGADLIGRLLWWGVVYGALDGVFLTVVPVLAVQGIFAAVAWSGTWYGVVVLGLVALIASIYITTAYHLGYPEFRNKRVLLPVAGNTIITLGMLVTGNPLAAIVSHAIMHIAAVVHGAEATAQLPPHYEEPHYAGPEAEAA